LDRQVLENTLLGFFQTVMVFVEYLFGLDQIVADAAFIEPWQADHPIDVISHHRGFGRHGRHHLELFEFLAGLGRGLLGHALALDLLFQILEFVARLVFGAHLLLDGPHLLVQVVVLLGLFHLLLDPALDALVHLVDFDFQFDQLTSRARRLLRSAVSSSCCLFSSLKEKCDDTESASLEGSEMADTLASSSLEILLLIPAYSVKSSITARIRASTSMVLPVVSGSSQLDFKVFRVGHIPLDAGALGSLDQRLDGAVGKPQQLEHRADDAHVAISFSLGLSTPAFLWVARKMRLSLFMALESALTDLLRPTKSGATMCGKTTMSLSGSRGSTSGAVPPSWFLKNFGILTIVLF
jgi:hypothetical protein